MVEKFEHPAQQPPGQPEGRLEVSESRGGVARGALVREVLSVCIVTLMAIKVALFAQETWNLPPDILVIVPALFLYVPLFWLKRKGLDPHDYGLTLEMWWPAIKVNLILLAIILPPFVVGNHYFQAWVFHHAPKSVLPRDFWLGVVAYHFFFVGFPEEFFYRGYVQSRLNEAFPKRWRVLGVPVGVSLLLTALLFTVGHSVVVVRWWHFSIFFPALAFGWIREKTGNVLASSLFHGCCNIMMVSLDTWYGVIPP